MIIAKKPPNYDLLVEAFGDLSKYKPVFAYMPNIYNPFNRTLTEDVIKHELIHIRQQGFYTSPEIWYNKYISDPFFRLEQETEAYGEQFLYVKTKIRGKFLDWLKEKLAMELSGPAYGNLINYQKAESLIRNYGKTR